MGQYELYEWLKANPGWHSTKEIAHYTRSSRASVQHAMKCLRRSRHVRCYSRPNHKAGGELVYCVEERREITCQN